MNNSRVFSELGQGHHAWAASWLVLLTACSGAVDGASGEGPAATGLPNGGSPSTSEMSTTTGGEGAGVTMPPGLPTSAPDTPVPPVTMTGEPVVTPAPVVPVDDGLPGRSLIRRLSNAEYAATIRSLLGDETDYAATFPSDTVVNGFTNNTDVQDVGPALAEQYMVAAEAISTKAVQDVEDLLGCSPSADLTCIPDFIAHFGKRAWRRPLTATEQNELLTLFQSEPDAVTGLRLVLQALLVSPSFLYRAEVGVSVPGQTHHALTSWEMASRLSYFLTGTMPDAQLMAAAEADELSTPAQVEVQARRLLATDAAREQVADFFSGWLNLRALERLERDEEQFPSWDTRLPLLFHDETRTFATRVVFDGGNLSTLLTASFTYGDRSLAAFYGGALGAADGDVARIELPAAQRAGLLTQASFLATHAKEIQTDPVARGKFVRERLLCQGVPAPPPDLVISPPEITPGSTTRQRFAQHEADPGCAGCHMLIDPIGLAFEHYDAVGQWRDQEQGVDIDASGELTASDVPGVYDGVVQMAAKLAESEMVAECFVRYWFRYALGRGESDDESTRMKTITQTFESQEQRVQELLIALTLTPDFLYLAKEGSP